MTGVCTPCYTVGMINRGTCREEGCEKPVAFKGRSYGHPVFRNICEFHRRPKRSTINDPNSPSYVDNSSCDRCGWSEAPCHRHRKSKNRDYTMDNVIVLCPNCHRLEHLRIGKYGYS